MTNLKQYKIGNLWLTVDELLGHTSELARVSIRANGQTEDRSQSEPGNVIETEVISRSEMLNLAIGFMDVALDMLHEQAFDTSQALGTCANQRSASVEAEKMARKLGLVHTGEMQDEWIKRYQRLKERAHLLQTCQRILEKNTNPEAIEKLASVLFTLETMGDIPVDIGLFLAPKEDDEQDFDERFGKPKGNA